MDRELSAVDHKLILSQNFQLKLLNLYFLPNSESNIIKEKSANRNFYSTFIVKTFSLLVSHARKKDVRKHERTMSSPISH